MGALATWGICGLGGWEVASDDAQDIACTRDTWQAMQPFASRRVYVNYLNEEADEGIDRTKAACGPETYGRLTALKARYDPKNLFRMNQKIRPHR